MRRIYKRLLLTILVLALFLFCAFQVAAQSAAPEAGVPEVITGGEVPVNYLEPEAYDPQRLAEGKAMFDAKCAICHTESGRDLVYFGDPDFNSSRVAGSVKKFVGAAEDPEIGEKVYEYLRYNNDGPFQSQDEPFLQPGPNELTLGNVNPVLSDDMDFWGALTGHDIPTPEDVDIRKIQNGYDTTQVILPYAIASWSEFMPHEVPLPAAMDEVWALFDQQRYNLDSLPLKEKGLGLMFNYGVNSIYTKHQFSPHDYFKMDHSLDQVEAAYSTSLLCKLGVMDFEFGLPQRVDGQWNSTWEWGPAEEMILWGPGSNLDNLQAYGINAYESISSREYYRNKWTQYSTMFVTGTFSPSSYYWYASMPWGCKTFDAGLFGGENVQLFTGMKGFAEMWNHSQTYTNTSYFGTYGISNYGEAVRKYLIDMYWQFEGLPYYSGAPAPVVNPFLEVLYRQWMAAIGVSDESLRTLISDAYNMPDGDRDKERYETLVKSYEKLRSAMSQEQRDFVVAYIRRLYPTDPSGYANSFTPYRWDLVSQAPDKPVLLPFGSETAVAGEEYTLRILRAQCQDGDIEVTAENLPEGAQLVKTSGGWRRDDNEYAIVWTPTAAQAGKTYSVTLHASSNMGESSATASIKVSADHAPLKPAGIPDKTVYTGQQLTFPLTVTNTTAEKLTVSMDGDFGKLMTNAWDTAGIFTVKPTKADLGKHTITFTAVNDRGESSQQTMTVTVLENSAPVVSMSPGGSGPGGNKNIYRVRAGETLRLTFDVTDPDGDLYEISKNADFPGTINGNEYTYTVDEEMAESFPGPNVLTFEIKDLAKAGSFFTRPEYKGGMAKKVLLVYFETADADPNHNPWAVAGSPQTVAAGQAVTLDGSGSDDTDLDPITYSWEQVSGPAVTLSDAAAVQPTFTAPAVSEPTVLKFYLTVSDPAGLSDAGVVRVKVDPDGSVPAPAPAPAPAPEPEPAAEPAPAPLPDPSTAMRSNQAVLLNGQPVELEVYNISGANYFRLRDVAALLSETGSCFSVSYDQEARAIRCVTGEGYAANGTELTSGDDLSATAVLSSQSLFVNGEAVDIAAVNLGGGNFFALRALGDTLGFTVDYDAAARAVEIVSK